MKVKELESQLLIERKLARQHVDSKIAEQHLKHQDQSNTPIRPALANKTLGTQKNLNDFMRSTRPLTENNILKQPSLPFSTLDNSIKCIDHAEKENNPDVAEKFVLPKRTGRASICTTTPHIPSVTALRRNSLIPLPSVPYLPQLPPRVTPVLERRAEEEDTEEMRNCLAAQKHLSPKQGKRSESKKRGSSMLRRSLYKKIQHKSPIQQHMRRVGVNVGMEKVRVSIGSQGRMVAKRGLRKNGRRNDTEETQQKNSQKEKERGWNVGTTSKSTF